MSNQQSSEQRLREILANRTRTVACDWHLVFKARYGMLECFKSIGETEGFGEVITQLLTCITAVDPIISAGFVPTYGDISEDAFSLDAAKLSLSDKTKAVVMQHTFGMIDISNSRRLAAQVKAHGALLLEDCAHCVGRFACGDDGLPLADVIFFSFGVEKILPTHFGGAVWINPKLKTGRHTSFYEHATARLTQLPALTKHLNFAAKTYATRMRILNHIPVRLSEFLRRLWIRSGSLEIAITEQEKQGMLPLVSQKPSEVIAAQVYRSMEALDEGNRERMLAVQKYARLFEGSSLFSVPNIAVDQVQPLLRFPLLAPSQELADYVVKALRSRNVWAEHWGRPLLFPGTQHEEVFMLPDMSILPVTTKVSERILCLPTDVTDTQFNALVDVFRTLQQ